MTTRCCVRGSRLTVGVALAVSAVVVALGALAAADEPAPRRPLRRLAPDAPPPSVDFQLVATLDDTMGPVYSLAWSPDGSTLATAAYQNLYLWDPDAGVVTEVLRGHTDFIWGVSWRPDGSMIATASWDRTVRIWRTSNMTEIASVSTGDAMCVAWSPSGHQLAIGTTGGSIVIWDPAVQLVVREWPVGSLVIDAEWSPDGSMLLVGDLIGRVSLYDAVSGELLDRFVTPVFSNDANGVTWSADGSTAVSAHQDGTIWMWNIDSGEPVRTLAAHGGWARGLDFSPDGWWLATTGMDAKADVWWTANWGLMVPLSEPPRAMWCAEWSPDGTKLAVGSGHYDSTAMGATYIWRITEQPASD